MDSLVNFISYIGPFSIVIITLVFFHELGHFLVARWCGVHVQVFAVGLGPRLFGFTDKHQTVWHLSLLPLGGYVKLLGGEATLDPEAIANIPEQTRHRSFPFQSLWKRAAIVAAGPIANIILSLIIFIGVFTFHGRIEPSSYLESGIGSVKVGSPSEKAGLQTGDIITRFGEEEIYSFEDLRRAVQLSNGNNTPLILSRGSSSLKLSLIPDTYLQQDGTPVYLIGVFSPKGKLVKDDIISATANAFTFTYDITFMIGDSLRSIVLPSSRGGSSNSTISSNGSGGNGELAGPVGIAAMARDAVSGGIVVLLMTIAIWSINLAIFNVLPIPVLDGGHLALFAIEAFTGKPVHYKIQRYLTMIGGVMLLSLFVYVTYGDILRLFS